MSHDYGCKITFCRSLLSGAAVRPSPTRRHFTHTLYTQHSITASFCSFVRASSPHTSAVKLPDREFLLSSVSIAVSLSCNKYLKHQYQQVHPNKSTTVFTETDSQLWAGIKNFLVVKPRAFISATLGQTAICT